VNKHPLPEMLLGDGVVLRRHSLDDAAKMFECVNADRERLGRYLPWVKHTLSTQDEIDYIRMTHQKWAACSEFDFSMHDDEGRYVGNIGVHSISWESERCEIGYWLAGPFEGRGLMSAAVRALEDALFELGFNRVEIRCEPSNRRSAAVPIRNGYTSEGTLRQYSKDGETYRDSMVFSKLRSDQRK
jgi:RimJ/RimL family protein N-acetyltransferase